MGVRLLLQLFLLPEARIAMPRSNLEWAGKLGGKFASCFMGACSWLSWMTAIRCWLMAHGPPPTLLSVLEGYSAELRALQPSRLHASMQCYHRVMIQLASCCMRPIDLTASLNINLTWWAGVLTIHGGHMRGCEPSCFKAGLRSLSLPSRPLLPTKQDVLDALYGWVA